ncbi:MAG: tetratricopeptide repeat protein [Candidatus Dadabacteria bacterium]|nr:tetratricopeptide repeat protein [Candidatus Dadabacteria bacterium]MYA48815.1 tetratricopeptide repeat protein [Candidatus Dadabacteria bacterium]MYF47467.1 tetratricopeptide repeat protein [Candidatus Dadabacteria bacterium]MYG82331.1 tetratricopeptide repeat protein [Candidatus Dadabacteria bacterium]MYK49850.1 tetratricopeptide repeat protein [Candidatus Dadabacteria bacterium]
MTKIKYTTKELKRPDRFREFLAESLEGLSHYFNRILIGIGVIVVILLGVCFASSQQEEKDLLANEQFKKALKSYDGGEMENSLSQLQTLREEHPKADVSVLALYQMGMINYQLENYEEAIKHLELFLDEDPEDGIFRDGANLVIGLSNFKLEKWNKSIEYFSEVDGSESPYYVQARRHLSLVYENTGEPEKAEKIRRETPN